MQIRNELRSYNAWLWLELGYGKTHWGQRSIMHIILIYKLLAKVQRIKANQNSSKLFQTQKKIK